MEVFLKYFKEDSRSPLNFMSRTLKTLSALPRFTPCGCDFWPCDLWPLFIHLVHSKPRQGISPSHSYTSFTSPPLFPLIFSSVICSPTPSPGSNLTSHCLLFQSSTLTLKRGGGAWALQTNILLKWKVMVVNNPSYVTFLVLWPKNALWIFHIISDLSHPHPRSP